MCVCVIHVIAGLILNPSFSFLWGPWAHLKHLLSCSRLPFTVCYISTVVGTLYSALIVSSDYAVQTILTFCYCQLHYTIITLVCAVAQVLALIW